MLCCCLNSPLALWDFSKNPSFFLLAFTCSRCNSGLGTRRPAASYHLVNILGPVVEPTGEGWLPRPCAFEELAMFAVEERSYAHALKNVAEFQLPVLLPFRWTGSHKLAQGPIPYCLDRASYCWREVCADLVIQGVGCHGRLVCVTSSQCKRGRPSNCYVCKKIAQTVFWKNVAVRGEVHHPQWHRTLACRTGGTRSRIPEKRRVPRKGTDAMSWTTINNKL